MRKRYHMLYSPLTTIKFHIADNTAQQNFVPCAIMIVPGSFSLYNPGENFVRLGNFWFQKYEYITIKMANPQKNVYFDTILLVGFQTII